MPKLKNASCARTDSRRATANITPEDWQCWITSTRILEAVKSIAMMLLASSTPCLKLYAFKKERGA